jgi:hypothetical protein
VVTARLAVANRTEELTDTQLVLLSAASQRDDRGVEVGSNLKGGAAHKVLGRLLTEGLVEEVPARGALAVWRWDEENRPLALRITPIIALPSSLRTVGRVFRAAVYHWGYNLAVVSRTIRLGFVRRAFRLSEQAPIPPARWVPFPWPPIAKKLGRGRHRG